jgi:hypothetical protein
MVPKRVPPSERGSFFVMVAIGFFLLFCLATEGTSTLGVRLLFWGVFIPGEVFVVLAYSSVRRSRRKTDASDN